MRALLTLWLGILLFVPAPAQQGQRGVTPAPAAVRGMRQGSYYALVIGINKYAQPLNALQTAANDASAVAGVLQKSYGFHTKLLLDTQATRAGIMDALSQYRQDLTEDDSLLIYYAGHGQYDKPVDKAYWLPVDAKLNSPAYWISASDITDEVRALPARHVLIVSDSCFSGGLTRDAGANLRADAHETFVRQMQAGKSRTLLSSGGNEPVADSGSNGHSVFANAILSGLTKVAGSPFTAMTLFSSIVEPVAGASAQVPEYNVIRNSGHDDGDFVFVPGTGAAGTAPPAIASARPPDQTIQVRQPQASDATAARARDALRSRGIGVDVNSVKNALVSADVETLKLLSDAAIQPAMIEEALRQHVDASTSVARRFFENSTSSADAMSWFDSALARVNPNLTIPTDYYEREGILHEAMRVGNWTALKLLLTRGASPHAYHNLFLTTYPVTRFLFPLRYISDDDRLARNEKQDMARAFLTAGVVIPRVIAPSGGSGWPSVMYAAQQLRDEFAPKLGIPLPQSPSLCEQQASPICKQASSRLGEDWCAHVASVPKKLTYSYSNPSSPLYSVSLEYLLSIESNKMYFLGLTKEINYDYVLVEVSKDGSSWTVLKMMSPEAGMGLCKTESDGVRLDQCWRKVSLQQVPGKDEMRAEGSNLSWKLSPNDCSSSDRK